MQESDAAALKSLIQQQPVAALATLHKGEPAVSMVPYALMPNGKLVIHVSRLASHTQDMQTTPAVALLITALLESAQTPLALPRISIQGTALPCLDNSPDYATARSVYLARFAEAEELFNFTDFSLIIIVPTSVRHVAGFGRARSLSPERFSAALTTI
ncbi:MAG TPA: pyridoxamine 5'-phosphate oxidase family protein [Cellvibrionaceae bacterium]